LVLEVKLLGEKAAEAANISVQQEGEGRAGSHGEEELAA